MESSYTVQGANFDEAGKVASQIKIVLKKLGLQADVIRKAALVAYESEINIVSYARKGTINISITPQRVKIETIDEGPGIPDISLAMQEGYSTADAKIREMGFGAGMGLCNINKYSDQFQITSEVEKGTHLKMIIHINNCA
ncbi:MAG: anti-sigma regulatory factor [Syntrophus sp. (in: bacteria)]|nr:anti-sigma regulatory factor [Syntrophus sp. (in: bacteria)]